MVADGSTKEALVELLKRKEIESKVASAFARVCNIYSTPFKISCTPIACVHFLNDLPLSVQAKDSDSAKNHEIKMRGELEDLLVVTRKQHEDLLKNKERAVAALESSMKRLGTLDARKAK